MSMCISLIKQKEKQEREKLDGKNRDCEFLTKFWYEYPCCFIQERGKQEEIEKLKKIQKQLWENRTTQKDRHWSQSVAKSGRGGTVTTICLHSIKYCGPCFSGHSIYVNIWWSLHLTCTSMYRKNMYLSSWLLCPFEALSICCYRNTVKELWKIYTFLKQTLCQKKISQCFW